MVPLPVSIVGWCSTTRPRGRMERAPRSPPARSTAAVKVAWPMQVVRTGGVTYCIASYTASMALMDPPGELMYRSIGSDALADSRWSSCAISALATPSSRGVPR
jgi:hypothetical protein